MIPTASYGVLWFIGYGKPNQAATPRWFSLKAPFAIKNAGLEPLSLSKLQVDGTVGCKEAGGKAMCNHIDLHCIL